MGRFKLLGLALLAVFASALALSASAIAVETPENLPTSSTTRTWEGKSETSEPEFRTEAAGAVICENNATAEGTEEPGKPLGLFHIHFLGCHSVVGGSTVKCTDLNHLTIGEILVLGTWHLVWDRKRGGTFTELTTAVLFLVQPVHFSCSSLVLIEVKGEQLCLHLSPGTRSRTHTFHCILEEAEAGKPRQTEEWCKRDVAGVCTEPVVPKLESAVNHAAFKESAELALGSTTYAVELFADV